MGNDIDILYNLEVQKAIVQLQILNTQLAKHQMQLLKMGTASQTAFNSTGKGISSLAMRFVGYNFVLNQVMGMQQKVVQYVQESVEKFREFELRIAEVSSIMGTDFKDSIYGLQAGVASLSVSFGKNTSDMAKGLYDIISAAFDAEEAIGLLGTATKAAIAGLSDIRTSVGIFTTVLNAYGMSAYEATSISDSLFQSVIRGKFQFQDLESALGYVVPIASQAGIAFDELMAALSTTTRFGVHLDMAARGLALGIQNIINPSTQAAKAAEKYGVHMDALTIRLEGLQGFFKVLNEKSKEYGMTVLNELIPNMRSLRVAMVLAGDEGVAGLAEDLDLLVAASGRTETALNKIMDTSQFASSQISQQFEQTQRDVGKAWDGVILGGQQAITWITKNWKALVPPMWGAAAAEFTIDKQLDQWKEAKSAQYSLKDIEGDRVAVMKKYLTLQEEIASLSEEVAAKVDKGEDFSHQQESLEHLTSLSTDLQDAFNNAFGEPILGGIRNLKELSTNLDEIKASMTIIADELSTPISVGWGDYSKNIAGSLNLTMAQKKAEQARVDTIYDVDQAMKDSTYTWKTHNTELKEAVSAIRDHEEAMKEQKKVAEEVNRAMIQLQIEALTIQITGMMRRRGLTRNEQKRLKQIQIEQAKLRLADMKSQAEANTQTDSYYSEKQDFIDAFINNLKREEYTLKYTLDAEIADLQITIDSETDLLALRQQEWDTTNQAILDSSTDLIKNLKDINADPELVELFKDIDTNIPDLLYSAKGAYNLAKNQIRQNPLQETRTPPQQTFLESVLPAPWKEFLGFKRGMEYVPEDMVAQIHRGEQIVPAGRDSSSGSIHIGNVTIQVNSIADISSAEKLGALLSEAQDKGIINVGTSRARNKKPGSTYRVI